MSASMRSLVLVLLTLLLAACDRGEKTTIRAPVDPPVTTTASAAPPRPKPLPTPPDFAMVAIAEGDPFGAAVPPAGASIEIDVVSTSRFVRFPVATGQTAREACVTLRQWVAVEARLPTGVALVCGEDRHALPAHGVRSWMIDPTPLMSRKDVLRAEIRYDEDTLPLHGHVVCELDPVAVKRWNAWAKAHPKVRIALEVGAEVIDVDDVGPATMTGGELWITPKIPFAMGSNDEATKTLAAAMSGDAGAP